MKTLTPAPTTSSFFSCSSANCSKRCVGSNRERPTVWPPPTSLPSLRPCLCVEQGLLLLLLVHHEAALRIFKMGTTRERREVRAPKRARTTLKSLDFQVGTLEGRSERLSTHRSKPWRLARFAWRSVCWTCAAARGSGACLERDSHRSGVCGRGVTWRPDLTGVDRDNVRSGV
jgi:hypothetical protein